MVARMSVVRLCFAAFIILSLAHSGCSGSGAPIGEPAVLPVPGDSQIPAMDELELTAPRLAADVAGVYDNAMLTNDHAYINQGALRLESPTDGTAWALWGWYGLSAADYPASVTVMLREGEGAYWVLIWDFERGCWIHSGPFQSAETTIAPPLLTRRAISPGGTFYVVVLTHGGNDRLFESLAVTTGIGTPLPDRPRWLTATDGAYPDRIEVDWHEAVEASSYRLIRWEHGAAESTAVVLGAALSAPPYTDDDVESQQLYYYRVFAANGIGETLGSPLDIGHAGSFAEAWTVTGTAYRHRIVPPYPLPFGIELMIADYEYMCGTGPDGRYVFPGIQEGTYEVWIVTPTSQVSIGQAQVIDTDAAGPWCGGSHQTAPDFEWYWFFPVYDLQLLQTGRNDATLSWSAVQWATEYRVYRNTSEDPEGATLLDAVEGTSYEVADQPVGHLWYWVQAVDASIEPHRETPWSNCEGFFVLPDVGPGTLYAAPLTGTASVGETVTVIVYTGEFPPAAQFQYLNGVGVKIEAGASYVDGTYNVGAVGGAQTSADGLWSYMDPVPVHFLLPEDFLIVEIPVDAEPELIFLGFHIVPIGGGDVTSGGDLFNFGLTFDQAGTYTLGFLEFQVVKRTYYADGANAEYYWSDIANDHPANTIVVE